MATSSEALVESNVRALRAEYPAYADILTTIPETVRFSFEAAGAAIGCRDADGRWLHGPDDPWEAARRDIRSLVDDEPRLYVVLRPGLGYQALAILEIIESRGAGSVVVVVEDRLDLWKAALGFTNWGPVLRCPSAVLLLGKPEIVIDTFLARHRDLALLPVTLVASPHDTADLDCSALVERLEGRSNAVHGVVEEELRGVDSLLQRRRKQNMPLRVVLAGEHGYLAGPFADGLRACGCSVEALPVESRSPRHVRAHDFAFKILRLTPDLVLWSNRPELSRFGSTALRALGIANVLWSVDTPRRAALSRNELATTDVHLYFDTTDLPFYAGLGSHRSEQLSLAAGIQPLPDCTPDQESWPDRAGPDVSFVGSLGEGRITSLREFIRQVRPEDLEYLDELASQPGDVAPSFEQETGKPYAGVPVVYVDEVRTARRRTDFLSRLPADSLTIFGSPDWGGEQSSLAACYRGSVPYGPDLASVYYNSRINLNVLHAQCIDSTNSRVYDVLAAGGFLLTEDRPVLHREFEVGRHLATFSSPEEVADKVAYFLAHPNERESIAREGQRHVLTHHTFRRRFSTLLELAQPFIGRAESPR